jgi:hypothetical protein
MGKVMVSSLYVESRSTVFACIMFGIPVKGTVHRDGSGLEGSPWKGLIKEKSRRDFN